MFSTCFKSLSLFSRNFYTLLSTQNQVWDLALFKVIHNTKNMTTFLRKNLVKGSGKDLVDIRRVGIYTIDGL